MQEQLEPGGYALEVDYTCHYAVAPDKNWKPTSENTINTGHTCYYVWQDGKLQPGADGPPNIEPGTLVHTFITLCSSQFFRLEDHGTPEEKAWAKQLRQLEREQTVASIMLTEPGGTQHVIGRYQGDKNAPRLDATSTRAPSLRCPGGSTIALAFTGMPDMGYTLTRYTKDGTGETVPIDNGIFVAQEKAGAMLYTLESDWWFGKYTYDFLIETMSDGKAKPALDIETQNALALGREYAKAITGMDFSSASSHVELFPWASDDPSGERRDEWEVELLWPNSRTEASIRFEPDGRMTFFALFHTSNSPAEAHTELPLLAAPAEILKKSYPDIVRYWFESLPIKCTGNLKKAELSVRNNTAQYTGRPLAKVKLRFDDRSVLTCEVDHETGRLTYFCLYSAAQLGRAK